MNIKQNKVVNKLNRECTQDASKLRELNKNPNDECYTSMVDILAELQYWGCNGKFKGKRIICPCDWDIVDGENIYSITINFEDGRVHGNSVHKVGAISYSLFDENGGDYETISLSPKTSSTAFSIADSLAISSVPSSRWRRIGA